MDKLIAGARELLPRLGERIRELFSDLAAAPGIIWEWSAADGEKRTIALLGFAAAAVMLLAVIVYYLRCLARKRRETPFALFFVLLLIGGGLWIAQHEILRFQVPETAALRTEAGEILFYDRCSLAPGVVSDVSPNNYMDPGWCLVDDTISWRPDERRVLQLTGLQSLCADRRYRVIALEHEPRDFVRFSVDTTTPGQTRVAELELYVLPDRSLSAEPWFREAGESVHTASPYECEGLIDFDGSHSWTVPDTDCTVLENDGERLLFTAWSDRFERTDLCLAWQEGPDLLIAVSHAFVNRFGDDVPSEHHICDPLSDEEERAFLREPLESLYDGRVRLLRDLPEETVGEILPSEIVNYPVPYCGTVDFAIPCRELLEMREPRYSEEEGSFSPQEIRFAADSPEGETVTWSLVNLSSVYRNPVSEAQQAMLEAADAAYRAGKDAPDPAMSEWLGLPAVAWEDAWLIRVGTYFGDQPAYYALSVLEAPAPADAPAP